MFNKIIFLGRSNCKNTKKVHNFLKKNSRKVLFFKSSFKNRKLKIKRKDYENCEYIFSFRGLFILNKEMLEAPKYFAINFHAGPPEYRGAGGVNFSIINRENYFGCTSHIMTEKIDYGRILDVKKFKVGKVDSVKKILDKLHLFMERQAISLIKKLLKDPKNLSEMIDKNKNMKWSEILRTINDLERLKIIDSKLKKSDFDRRVRATTYKHFIPKVI